MIQQKPGTYSTFEITWASIENYINYYNHIFLLMHNFYTWQCKRPLQIQDHLYFMSLWTMPGISKSYQRCAVWIEIWGFKEYVFSLLIHCTTVWRWARNMKVWWCKHNLKCVSTMFPPRSWCLAVHLPLLSPSPWTHTMTKAKRSLSTLFPACSNPYMKVLFHSHLVTIHFLCTPMIYF